MTPEEYKARIEKATSAAEIRQLSVEYGMSQGTIERDLDGQIHLVESVIAAQHAEAERQRARLAVQDAQSRVHAAEQAAQAERDAAAKTYAAAKAAGAYQEQQPTAEQVPTFEHKRRVVIYDAAKGIERPAIIRANSEAELDQLQIRYHARSVGPRDAANGMQWYE